MVKVMKQNRLSLDDVEWGEFFIGGEDGVFKIYSTKSGIDKNKLNTEPGSVPYITRSDLQNGINLFVTDNQSKTYLKNDGNVITIGLDTQTVFYQNNDFFTGQNIQILENKHINKSIALFIIPLLKIQMRKFNWGGNGATLSRLKRTKILLPLDLNKKPNRKFMEDYIKQEQKDIVHNVIYYYEKKMLETSFDLVGFGDVEWRNFKVGDLFDFDRKPSKGLNNLEIATDNGISYLGATNRNNGVLEFVEPRKDLIYKGDCIAFIRNGEGSMGYSIYKKENFIATQDISVGYNINLNQYNGMFITTIADRVRGKYNFGYKRNQIRLENEILTLPADKNGNPHWEYMSEFMKKLEAENLEKVLEYIYIYRLAVSYEFKICPLYEKEWKEFWLEDIVKIKSGVRLTKANQIAGNIPFIGSTDNGNGITNFISNKNSSLDDNVLGVNYNGSVVENFYHPYQAIFSDDVKRIHWKNEENETKYTYLFLKQAILKQKEKYAYGYKFNASRMNRQKILLPIDDSGELDYDYMEKYMQIKELKEQYRILNYYYKVLS